MAADLGYYEIIFLAVANDGLDHGLKLMLYLTLLILEHDNLGKIFRREAEPFAVFGPDDYGQWNTIDVTERDLPAIAVAKMLENNFLHIKVLIVLPVLFVKGPQMLRHHHQHCQKRYQYG